MLPWLLKYILLLPDTSPSLVSVTRILQAVMEACVLHDQESPLLVSKLFCTLVLYQECPSHVAMVTEVYFVIA